MAQGPLDNKADKRRWGRYTHIEKGGGKWWEGGGGAVGGGVSTTATGQLQPTNHLLTTTNRPTHSVPPTRSHTSQLEHAKYHTEDLPRRMQAGPRHQHTPDSVHGVAGLGRGASPAPALGDTGVAGSAGAWSSFTSSNSSYARQSSSVARCRFRAVTARGAGESKPLAEAVSAPETARADAGEG